MKISFERIKQQGGLSPKNQKHGSNDDILNFPDYFTKHKPIKGINFPELENNRVYMSVYHFLQYERIDPRNYETRDAGGYLFKECPNNSTLPKMELENYCVHKYPYDFLKSKKITILKNFKKGS